MVILTALNALIVGLLLLRTAVLIFNFLSKPYLYEVQASVQGMVSVLIPARNEAHNIGHVLSDLIKQDHAHIEILVYDDLSEDHTPAIVQAFARDDARVRLLPAKPLPTGWLGKNHACHQLALEAKGDYLLFVDADVRLKPNAITAAIHYLQKHRLQALSLFPTQITLSRGERLMVPLMLWVLLSLLPLRLIQKLPLHTFAAANGQFFLHAGAQYRKHWWHQAFRQNQVEDLAIARAIKKKGMRMATLLGNRMVSCRMYYSYAEALQGFSKNFAYIFGNNIVIMLMFALLDSLGWLLPVFLWPWQWWLPLLLTLMMHRCLMARLGAMSCRQQLVDAPAQQMALLHLAIHIVMTRRRGSLEWKGRKINQISKT